MSNINDHLNSAAQAIITARDFCGDEREAVRDYAAENGILFSRDFLIEARRRADAIWAGYQRAAGVKKPLSSCQRRKAYAALA